MMDASASTGGRPAAALPSPVLIELDAVFWAGQLDYSETFLGTVVAMQASFRQLADDMHRKVRQPQYRGFLGRIAEEAHRHEDGLREFYRLIGREPAHARALSGSIAAKGREVLADVESLVSGASSIWHDLRQLWMSSHSAEGAVGVVEQLGYALGQKEFAEHAYRMVNEKHRSTLVIQEIVLEMAAPAVLYGSPVEAQFGPRTTDTGPFLPDVG